MLKKDNNKILGHLIELFVCKMLIKKGYLVLKINFSTKYGEIDIIAIDYSKYLLKIYDKIQKNYSDQNNKNIGGSKVIKNTLNKAKSKNDINTIGGEDIKAVSKDDINTVSKDDINTVSKDNLNKSREEYKIKLNVKSKYKDEIKIKDTKNHNHIYKNKYKQKDTNIYILNDIYTKFLSRNKNIIDNIYTPKIDFKNEYNNFIKSTFNDIYTKNIQNIDYEKIKCIKNNFLSTHLAKNKNLIKKIKNNNADCCLVFIEVKTKTTNLFGTPEQMISTKKLSNIHKVSTLYPQYKYLPKRVDIIAVSVNKQYKSNVVPYFKKINVNVMSLNNNYNNKINMKNSVKINKNSKINKSSKVNKKPTPINSKNININPISTIKGKSTPSFITPPFAKNITLKHYRSVYFNT